MHEQLSDASLPPLSPIVPALEVTENKRLNQRVLLSGCAEGRLCAWSVATSRHPQSTGQNQEYSMHSRGPSGTFGTAGTSPQFMSGREGSGNLGWGGTTALGMISPPGGAPDGMGEAWDVFGEPMFSVHALTEPVWQIVLPPQNAPPQWHQCASTCLVLVAFSVTYDDMYPPSVFRTSGSTEFCCSHFRSIRLQHTNLLLGSAVVRSLSRIQVPLHRFVSWLWNMKSSKHCVLHCSVLACTSVFK